MRSQGEDSHLCATGRSLSVNRSLGTKRIIGELIAKVNILCEAVSQNKMF